MWDQILYLVLLAESGDTTSLFANKEGSSSERRMEGGIADETSMPPLKCECFGSAAQGQPPSWVHTGLTASSMNVKCQTKHENRPSLYCSFSSHQKSVSADDKSKHNKPSPSSPEPTSWLWLCTWVTAAAASAIAASQSPQHMLCVFSCQECFTISEERRGEVSTARPPATKSPFLLMTNQNITSLAPHHQNQPPDFGSVHESQQQQLRLSLHRSHRHTRCVEECFTIFRGEKRHNWYVSPP